MLRGGHDVLYLALFHNHAFVDDDNPLTYLGDHAQIVGNQDNGLAAATSLKR